MTSPKHTPTPWHRRIGREGDGSPASQHEQICNESGVAVTMLEHDGSDEADANAEFILRAVNNHEALVEALQELADLMDDIRAGTYEPDSFTTQPARAALAAVEGAK